MTAARGSFQYISGTSLPHASPDLSTWAEKATAFGAGSEAVPNEARLGFFHMSHGIIQGA